MVAVQGVAGLDDRISDILLSTHMMFLKGGDEWSADRGVVYST